MGPHFQRDVIALRKQLIDVHGAVDYWINKVGVPAECADLIGGIAQKLQECRVTLDVIENRMKEVTDA